MAFDKKKYQREWYLKNREYVLAYAKKYNQEHQKERREYWANYTLPVESRKKRNEHKKVYRITKKFKVSQRNSTLKKKYGITLEDFNQLILEQNNTCPICLRIFIDKVHPCVDHCHETKRVRGVLCRQCNAAVGQLGDTKESLERALDYLTR